MCEITCDGNTDKVHERKSDRNMNSPLIAHFRFSNVVLRKEKSKKEKWQCSQNLDLNPIFANFDANFVETEPVYNFIWILALVFGQEIPEAPSVEVGISDDLVHEGNEASVTCRVQNQGSYQSKSKYS